MSFLDRFKRKASDEKPSETTPPEVKPEVSAEPGPPRRLDPAIHLAAATVAAGYNPDFKLPPKKEKEAPASAAPAGPHAEVTLELSDFLSRLPTNLLKDETHDPKTPLNFEIGELADRISRGQTTIPLVEVYRRAPGIFRAEVLASDSTEIRFPWQKVMKMLTAYRSPGAPAPAGLTSAAAESLAERLRSRRAVRNIIPGGPGSDTTAPIPAPGATTASIAPPSKPPELIVPTSSAEEDEKMSKEEALKARDQIRNQLVRIKGEFERHLAAGEQQRKVLADEREKVLVDLVQTKKELDDKIDQIDFEKSVASKSTENLSKVQQDRDAYKLDLSNLKVEINKLTQQNEQRIKDLVNERDALAQQQANLAKQISEFQKRGKIGAVLGAETAATTAAAAGAAAAAERTQREYQRQIDELQRRIQILETGQRDAAQELGREREAKIKIERQLAAADRGQQDSASKVQELQANLQREHEAALRKREADAARALKEAQDQAAALQATNQKLQTEFESVRKQLAAAQEAAASAIAPEEWEARATAQFEADIESYRTRIKTLLLEREALTNAKKELADQLVARTKEIAQQNAQKDALLKAQAESQPKADAIQILEQNEKLQAQIKALESERDTLSAKARGFDEKLAAATAATAALQKLTTEKEAALAELAKAKSELTETATKHQQDFLKLQERHAAELAAKETALRDAAAKPVANPEEIAQLRSELEATRTGSNSAISTLRVEKKKALTDLTAAQKERDALTAELEQLQDSLQEEKQRLEKELTAAKAGGEAAAKSLAELKGSQEKIASEKKALADELDALRASHEAATSDTSAALAEREKVLAELTKDRDTLRSKLEGTAKNLAAAQKQYDDLAAGRETLSAENAAARSALEKSLAEVTRQRDELLTKIETLAGDLAAAKQEHGVAFAALDKDRDSLRAAREALGAEFATFRAANEKALAELHAKHDTLAVNKEETDKLLAEAQQHIAELEAALQKTEATLAETQAVLKKRDEAASKQARDHHEALTSLTSKHERVLAALAAEKDAALAKLASEKATLVAEVDDQIATLKANHEKAVYSLRDEKSETIIRITDEMNATVSALTVERDKVRDALAEAERKYTSEIAALMEARDGAQHDSATVAERLAAISVEAEKKQAALTEERDALLAEKQKLTAEFEQARETHKAQAGVFASEFKTVIKQRDDVISQLEAERARLAERSAEIERERTAMAAAEREAKSRFERETARIRRERDSIVQQRDALRERIEKQVDEQRQMLEEVTTQAAFTSMKHSDAAARAEAEEASERAEPEPAAKPRRETHKETNVIDITEAEIVAPLQGEEGRLKMPRVRPVVIPPPQVRSL
jgi:chromosome segregation ATPase